MISAISWVPKGASKSEPLVAEPPSKEEIEQFVSKVATLDITARYILLCLLSIIN